MFPGAGAEVYRNEAGEPLGFDRPSDDPPEPEGDFISDVDVEDECEGAPGDDESFPIVCANGCPEGYLGRHKFSCELAGRGADDERDHAEEEYNRRLMHEE